MPRVLPLLLTPVLALTLVAGGCAAGSDDRSDASGAPSSGPASPSASSSSSSASSSPAGSPEESVEADGDDGGGDGGGTSDDARRRTKKSRDGGEKVDLGMAPTARRGAARSHLLGADTLPPAGDDLTWSVAGTGPEGETRVGSCQRTSLYDLGALRTVLRRFDGPQGSGFSSRQAVARFADPKSAWRAHQVLRSWRADCEDHLDEPGEIGKMRKVALDAGSGGRYRVEVGAQDTDHTGLGIVRSRAWLSVVDIVATKGDFPRRWTRRAVRKIAETF